MRSTAPNWNLISYATARNAYSYSTISPLCRTSRTRAPRMFSPLYILALALYFPLFALGSPAVLSHYPLPPPLCNRTLSLVRENAINISTHRSVYAPPTPSPRSSPWLSLTNDGQLGNWHACRGIDRVRVAAPRGVRSWVYPAARTPQKGRGGRCTLHCREVRLFFSPQVFPHREAVKHRVDTPYR